MSLASLPAAELLNQLQAGAVTAVEVTQAFLDRIAQRDGALRAFLRVSADKALQTAADIDRRRRLHQPVGALAGLPVAIKDILCERGDVVTCASRMLEHFAPPYDATVIEKLRAADAVLIGRTNLDEFAMGGSTENSAFGPTRNPWDATRIAGGSSGGSAAAVAAGMAPLALGTDTGGSIRQPAALCGVTGLKPTYGRVSRYGLIAFASSLDQVGPLGSSAQDVALLLGVIAGHDPRDATSVDQPVPDYAQALARPLAGLRLGVAAEHFAAGLDPSVEAACREALRVFQSLGASVEEISLPHGKYAVATYYVIAPCEASSNLARYDGAHYGHRASPQSIRQRIGTQAAAQAQPGEGPLLTMYRQSREEGFGPEVKRRIMLGTYALSAGYYDAYYLTALKVRRLIHGDYQQAFQKVDLIAGPCTATPAFPLGEKADNPLAMYLVDLYTVGANLAGIPAMSIPCGHDSQGLPIGLQLQGPHFAEERLLQAGHAFQQATDWHLRRA
jgi:aspartyl-tRNA(Asn)/glutamyl-tRNA(Gln) amidotransferase subunit A